MIAPYNENHQFFPSFPCRVPIGAFWFDVDVVSSDADSDNPVIGCVNEEVLKITIEENQKRKNETLVHEIMEAACAVYDLVIPHTTLCLLSGAVTQGLQSVRAVVGEGTVEFNDPKFCRTFFQGSGTNADVKIGPYTFNTLFKDSPVAYINGTVTNGFTDGVAGTITVFNSCVPGCAFETFIHELCEATKYVYNLQWFTHEDLTVLAAATAQALMHAEFKSVSGGKALLAFADPYVSSDNPTYTEAFLEALNDDERK